MKIQNIIVSRHETGEVSISTQGGNLVLSSDREVFSFPLSAVPELVDAIMMVTQPVPKPRCAALEQAILKHVQDAERHATDLSEDFLMVTDEDILQEIFAETIQSLVNRGLLEFRQGKWVAP